MHQRGVRCFCACCLLLLTWCSFFWPPTDESLTAWKEAYEQGDYEQAITYLQQASSQNNKEAYLYLAKSYQHLWNTDAARLAIDHALRKDATYVDALTTKSLLLLEQRNYNQAMDLLKKAEKQQPRNPDVLSTKWFVHYKLWQYDTAIIYFNKALAVDAQHVHALANKAATLADSWRPLDSLPYFEQAIAVDPENYILYYNKWTALSDLAYQKKLTQETWYAAYAYQALETFDQVKLLNPDYIKTYVYEGITYYDLWRYEQALTLLRYATEKEPWNLDARLYSWKILKALFREDEAREAFQRVLELVPWHEDAIYELSELWI